MRKHLRAIARANMERAGHRRINKPMRTINGGRGPSLFASEWRDNLKTPPEIERNASRIRALNEHKRLCRNESRA